MAVLQATRVYNSLPHKTTEMKIPFELFQKIPATTYIKHLKRFGSIAYRLIPRAKATTTKFEQKGEKCVILGMKPNAQHILVLDKNILTIGSDLH